MIHDVSWLSDYFSGVGDGWRLALRIAFYRNGQITYGGGGGDSAFYKYLHLEHYNRDRAATFPPIGETEEHHLIVQRLHLNSPLEITLATAGSTGVTIYALYLLSALLRDPERLGSWIPRLVASWHRARRDAANEKQLSELEYEDLLETAIQDEIERLPNRHIKKTRPVDLTVTADSEMPPDIAAALEADEDDKPTEDEDDED
jgi:hypothetical protein